MTRTRLITLILGTHLAAQTATIMTFVGFPSRRSVNKIGTNDTAILEEKESKEYLCMISLKSGKYYWSSRDNKEMTKHISGAFVIFAADDGSGYVKLLVQPKGLPLDYMEHLHDKLFTVTYWGKSSTYRE